MLANIWQWLHAHPPTHWPEATLGVESMARSEYLAAIRAADDGDYGPLIELHRRRDLLLESLKFLAAELNGTSRGGG